MREGVAKPIETLLFEAGSGSVERRHSPKIVPTFESFGDNLGWEFVAIASGHPNRVALTTPSGSRTYSELMDAAIDVCHRLRQSQSFHPGSRVLLLLPNSQEYLAAFYGTLLAVRVV